MPRGYDDDDDDRPRKRSRDDDDDDYEDERPTRRQPLSGMDGMYTNTSFPVLILFSVCCNGLCLLPFILSLIGTFTCKDKTAQANARICLIISSVMVVIGVVANIVRFAISGPAAFGLK